jgi:hypothetical protein
VEDGTPPHLVFLLLALLGNYFFVSGLGVEDNAVTIMLFLFM